MTAEPVGGLDVAAWVAHEESRPGRRELVAGRLVLVQGASDRHDTIVTTLYDRLAGPFRSSGCRVHPHNRRVVTAAGDGYYPDLVIRCGPRTDDLYETRPSWVFEVLSPSNTQTGMHRKLRGYLSIQELEGYVVIDPDSGGVTAYIHQGGDWHVLDVSGGTLPVGPVLLDFAEVFADVAAQLRLGNPG
jgi:Uma2 family endonuclease